MNCSAFICGTKLPKYRSRGSTSLACGPCRVNTLVSMVSLPCTPLQKLDFWPASVAGEPGAGPVGFNGEVIHRAPAPRPSYLPLSWGGTSEAIRIDRVAHLDHAAKRWPTALASRYRALTMGAEPHPGMGSMSG